MGNLFSSQPDPHSTHRNGDEQIIKVPTSLSQVDRNVKLQKKYKESGVLYAGWTLMINTNQTTYKLVKNPELGLKYQRWLNYIITSKSPPFILTKCFKLKRNKSHLAPGAPQFLSSDQINILDWQINLSDDKKNKGETGPINHRFHVHFSFHVMYMRVSGYHPYFDLDPIKRSSMKAFGYSCACNWRPADSTDFRERFYINKGSKQISDLRSSFDDSKT